MEFADQIENAAEDLMNNANRIANALKSGHLRELSFAIRRNLGKDKIDELEFSAYDGNDCGTIRKGSLDDSIVLFEALSAFEPESEKKNEKAQ